MLSKIRNHVNFMVKHTFSKRSVPDAIQFIINFTLTGFNCPVSSAALSQIIALLNQVLAALGGLLEIVSIDTGCDSRVFRNSDLVMSIGVIVADDGAKNETEYYEAIEGLLEDGNDTLADNGFLDVVVDDEPEYLDDYQTNQYGDTQQKFEFQLTSMDDTFTNETEPANEAGQKVYFSLNQIGSEMGEFLEYTVSKCGVFQENGDNFAIYEHDHGCGNFAVDGVLQKVGTGISYRFDLQYILFMFSGDLSNTAEEYSEYSLVCEVMLCLVDDQDSACKTVSDNCS